jgi:hypothetical protein
MNPYLDAYGGSFWLPSPLRGGVGGGAFPTKRENAYALLIDPASLDRYRGRVYTRS